MLIPYLGTRTSDHFGSEPGPSRRTLYGNDTTGTKVYEFNSLGFRCKEFDETALAKIYFCGCSNTFGTGLNAEETWPVLFAEKYRTRCGIPEHRFCMMNFSQGGASNRYIARTLVTQGNAHPPDLVVAHFTYIERTEFYLPPDLSSADWPDQYAAVHPLGLWGLRVSWLGRLRASRNLPENKRRTAIESWRWGRRYYRNYSEPRALYESLCDILLVQEFCRARRIPLVACCPNRVRTARAGASRNRAIAAMYEIVMPGLLDFSIDQRDILVDRAVDGIHPGPRSSRLFAEKLWAAFEEMGSAALPASKNDA